MKPVVFHPFAAQEAHNAGEQYEARQLGLGDVFRFELDASLVRIRSNPNLYSSEQEPIRIAPFHRFPYLIFYEEYDDHIWVTAVGHNRRRPGYWSGREHI